MNYLIKMPAVVQRWLFPNYLWKMPVTGKKLYLSFDDGPHPAITPFVLRELKKYNAKASFFCVGKNVAEYPEVYKKILLDGHAAGNHTYDHLNGWKVDDAAYFNNIAAAAKVIDSELFRPPYGRVSSFQAKMLREKWQLKIVMWTILSGDFDPDISWQRCVKNVIKNVRAGDIIVFHDSEKAFPRLEFALPEVLRQLSEEGYLFDKIS